MSESSRPRAFAVWFKDLARWDPSSFHDVFWHWPAEVMKPLGSVLKIRKEKVNRTNFAFADLQPITIHFDGSLDKRKVDPIRAYTMDLYFARPGDIVVAKIDLKNGAVGMVPEGWGNAVVTGHFAVYEPDLTQVVPEYLLRLIQTRFFKAHLNRNKVGAEGRKEVKLSFFESEPIPLPPLPIQQAIVAQWEAAQAEVSALRAHFVDMEGVTNRIVLDSLGIPAQEFKALPKAFALYWKDIERWSARATMLRVQQMQLKQGKFPIVLGRECLKQVKHGCSASPSSLPTTLEVIKISAVTRGDFNPSERKYMYDVPSYRQEFDLRAGDIIMCRTNGTLAYVGRSCLVENDTANTIFPDKVIRLRTKENIMPQYLNEILGIRALRAQIEAAARTAVGNYAIGNQDIWSLQVPLPPLDVQREIVERVQAQRQEMARLRELAERKTREIKADVEALILGTRPVEQSPPSPQ